MEQTMKRFKITGLVVLVGLFVSLLSLLEAGDPGSVPPAGEKRIALVIGNGAYVSDNLGPLHNPPNDAAEVTNALQGFGFEVHAYTDLKKSAMDEAIVDFGRRAGHADAALFYFAGHGLQIKSQNFLMPIDATANSEASVGYEGVNVNYILDEMENARSNINIVMLDACRNNSFTGKFRGGQIRGLAVPASMPKGTVIVYATDPGNVASDGTGKNGLFTAGLLAGFNARDLSLDGVLTAASRYVEEKSGREQTPYVNGPQTVMKQFMFRVEGASKGAAVVQTGTAGTVPGGGVGQADREALFWQSAQGDLEICQEYLKKYPHGEFVVPARRCVEKGQTVARDSLAPSTPPVASETPLDPMNRQMVAGRVVQMRENPEANGKLVRELAFGEKVHVLGRTADGQWYWAEAKTWLSTKRGYVVAEPLVDETNWEETKQQRLEVQKAEQGDAKAQFNLAVMYENGTGLKKNREEAIKWYLKAAEQGHESAKTRLLKLGHAHLEDVQKGTEKGEQADFSSISEAISQWQPTPSAPSRSTRAAPEPGASPGLPTEGLPSLPPHEIPAAESAPVAPPP